MHLTVFRAAMAPSPACRRPLSLFSRRECNRSQRKLADRNCLLPRSGEVRFSASALLSLPTQQQYHRKLSQQNLLAGFLLWGTMQALEAADGASALVKRCVENLCVPMIMTAAVLWLSSHMETSPAEEKKLWMDAAAGGCVTAAAVASLLDAIEMKKLSFHLSALPIYSAVVIAANFFKASIDWMLLGLLLFSAVLTGSPAQIDVRRALSSLLSLGTYVCHYPSAVFGAPAWVWGAAAGFSALGLYSSIHRRSSPLATMQTVLGGLSIMAFLYLSLFHLNLANMAADYLPVDSTAWSVAKIVIRTALLFQLGMMIRSFVERKNK